jgi:hypothetical protein
MPHIPTLPPAFDVIYDLRNDFALRKAHRDRQFWGKLYTDIAVLDNDHIVLTFRPAGERWEKWETVRRRWILERAA